MRRRYHKMGFENKPSQTRKGSGPVGEAKLAGWVNVRLDREWVLHLGACFELTALAGDRNDDDNTFTPAGHPDLALPIYFKSTKDSGRIHAFMKGLPAQKAFGQVQSPRGVWGVRPLADVMADFEAFGAEGHCI